MEDPITRAEHEEFKLRIEEENQRQNRRIDNLEENTKQLSSLTISVEKLAQSVQQMCRTQEQESRRLEQLEARDGAKWRHAVGYAATAVVSILAGACVSILTMGF